MTFQEILPKLKEKTLVDNNRLKLIYDKVIETKQLPFAMAEIGVYKGGTSYLIASAGHPDRILHACDSFEGLPETTEEDIMLNSDKYGHKRGDFIVQQKEVFEYLNPLGNVNIYKGFFPDPIIHENMYNLKYSFVHLDTDLYKSTLDCLEFFWPRMMQNGIIVSDDYEWKATPGVKRAFDEFFKDVQVHNSGFNSCWVKKL